jgi:hypothetical protein
MRVPHLGLAKQILMLGMANRELGQQVGQILAAAGRRLVNEPCVQCNSQGFLTLVCCSEGS